MAGIRRQIVYFEGGRGIRCGHAVCAVSVSERSGHMTIDYDSPHPLVRTPQQVNEFICTRCILVRELSDLAADRSQGRVCRDCA